MKYLKASEMFAYEQEIIENKGVPAIVLMECAARAVVTQMKQTITKSDSILVVCGDGNNGGDGLAVGRILHNEGYKVTILEAGDPKQRTSQNSLQSKIAKNYGTAFVSQIDHVNFKEFTVFVDALFGIGLSRKISGAPLEIIKKINGVKSSRVYAIDVPSGISAEKGVALGIYLQADETITFGFYKKGMEKSELQESFGKITVADIGFFY